MNSRSSPARPRSGTRNPVVQLAELFAQGDIERAREIYNKSIVPLSRDDARRYLTSSDDALVLILNMMQTGTSNSNSEAVNRIHQCGWTLLWKALGARRLDDEQRVSPDKRLYIRLLLRHIDLLCSSGLDLLNHVNTLFGAWCKDAERLEQNWLQRIHAMHGVGDVTLSLLSLLVLLLTETHKERDARSVACMLGCLRNFYHIAATLVSMENDPRVGLLQKMFGSFHLCWQIAPVIIERVVAALPPECLDDDIAHILVPYAYCVPKRAAEYCEMNCIRPENAVLWFLREVLCLEVAFNKDYVHAMIDDAAPPIIMSRTGVMLLCKLPEEQLRRIIFKDKLEPMLAVRECALGLNWYAIEEAERVCFAPGCGKCGYKFKRCAGCRLAEYCSVECQRNDWPTHKPMCLHWRKTSHNHDAAHGSAD